MKKIYLTFLLSLFIAPALALAAYDDVSMSASSVISVGGYSLVISGTASFDSITVNADNFTVDLSKNAAITVTSADKINYTVSPDQYRQSFFCGSDSSTLTVGNNLWDTMVTVTITPSSSACSVSGGGLVGEGGIIPTTPPIEANTEDEEPVSQTPELEPDQILPIKQSISPVFNKTLEFGMIDSDVKRLQQLLNSDSDTMIALSGVGSPGNETNYFGLLTRKAVMKFQAKYGIISSGDEETTGYGLFGPKTRAKFQEVFSQTVAPASTKAPIVASAERQALIDSVEAQIKSLQEKLAQLLAELTEMLKKQIEEAI